MRTNKIETDETNDLDENLCRQSDILITAAASGSATVSDSRLWCLCFVFMCDNTCIIVCSGACSHQSHSAVSNHLLWLCKEKRKNRFLFIGVCK